MLRPFFLSLCLFTATACSTAPEVLPFPVVPVSADVETDPMIGVGDRADDPAIWVHPTDASRSLILGTNKEEGLYIYGLDGHTLQFLDVGRLNNIDVRDELAVGSNDEVNALSWFAIDPGTATVAHIGDTPLELIEPYGVCAGIVEGTYFAAPTYKDGKVELWAATRGTDGTLSVELVRTLQLPGQLEGCVFDDAGQRLFIGEEEFGIWVLDLAGTDAEPVVFDTIANANGLVMDVEGLSIWRGVDRAGYLVASAQAADRFVVYDLSNSLPVGIFTITGSEDGAIDSVTHTDGLDISSAPLPGYPSGLVVVQDDGNPDSGVDQNFKLVDWAAIVAALHLDASSGTMVVE